MILFIKMFCQIEKPSVYLAIMAKQKAFGDRIIIIKCLIKFVGNKFNF